MEDLYFSMIFVTVGTHNQGFERLIKEVDRIAKDIDEPIFIQRGCTLYRPQNCNFKDFLTQQEFEQKCRNASLVITHGGIGSIMTPLLMGKKVLIVPRLKKYKEHTDDHQLQITKELERQGKVLAVYDIKKIEQAIIKAKRIKTFTITKNKKLQNMVEGFIQNYENRNSA